MLNLGKKNSTGSALVYWYRLVVNTGTLGYSSLRNSLPLDVPVYTFKLQYQKTRLEFLRDFSGSWHTGIHI